MKAVVSALAVAAISASAMWAEESKTKEVDRVSAAAKVLSELMATPDKGIPEKILTGANCVAVVPSMLKAGFVVGARYGKGVATCRTSHNTWSAPAPFRIEGGDWGLQIGGEAIDLVMVVMNKDGMQQLLSSKFKIGADASAAAGPIGRQAEGEVDWKMRAEILTYSRARGVFAGVTLNGAEVKQDTDDTLALYGRDVSFEKILTGKVPPPTGTRPFLAEVAKVFHEAKAAEQAKTEEKESESAGGSAGTAASSSDRASRQAQGDANSNDSIGNNTQAGSQDSPAATKETTPQSQVQAEIQSALQNASGVSAQGVDVRVVGDTVSLSGAVPTDNDKAAVRRIAQEKAGGRTVDDSNVIVK
jgi:lipid-binding SYLF domain-containing protein